LCVEFGDKTEQVIWVTLKLAEHMCVNDFSAYVLGAIEIGCV